MYLFDSLQHLGFSKYETQAYLALLKNHPLNGSQLSRLSRVPRANIYNLLIGLKEKGLAIEVEKGFYSAFPLDELVKRLRRQSEQYLLELEASIDKAEFDTTHEYVWTIYGYKNLLNKAKEMLASATDEVYIRLTDIEASSLKIHLLEAASKGVQIKCILIGQMEPFLDLQVVHPKSSRLDRRTTGRPLEIIRDKQELLVGLFYEDKIDRSPFSWAKNHPLVLTSREGIRHDFFHYLFHKIYEDKQDLSERERHLYDLIKNDHWSQRT